MAGRDKTATVDIKIRMKEPLRAEVEAAAKDRGVSMNAEMVARLAQSFRDEGLFASPGVRLWAILKADEFSKTGQAAAARAGLDTADQVWMNNPACLLEASLAVVEALLRDLVRQPGADPENINFHLEHALQSFAARHGLLGEHMKSGFFPRKDKP